MTIEPLERHRFDASTLIHEFPPKWHDRNKQAVFDHVCSVNPTFAGLIAYSRWPATELPRDLAAHGQFEVRDGVFDYPGSVAADAVEWHMNFADSRLFVAYGSALLAQDELQVAEHPILGSVRDAIVAAGTFPATIHSGGSPTPITISGVERRCAIDTRPDPQRGRARGLYGNAFARATVEDVLAATQPLLPPTVSNVLAIAAPACGDGAYTRDQIAYVVSAAYSGFSAARRESGAMVNPSRTVIHTGYWGCGAFGGNRVLMAALQAVAAGLADVDIVFHTGTGAGIAIAAEALALSREVVSSSPTVTLALDAFVQKRFLWGVSDGN